MSDVRGIFGSRRINYIRPKHRVRELNGLHWKIYSLLKKSSENIKFKQHVNVHLWLKLSYNNIIKTIYYEFLIGVLKTKGI